MSDVLACARAYATCSSGSGDSCSNSSVSGSGSATILVTLAATDYYAGSTCVLGACECIRASVACSRDNGGSSSSSPLSARGKLVNMVRVFKEDIQKRKDDSDRKNGKGGSGKPISSIFTLSIALLYVNNDIRDIITINIQ